jgi:hypothetical protein
MPRKESVKHVCTSEFATWQRSINHKGELKSIYFSVEGHRAWPQSATVRTISVSVIPPGFLEQQVFASSYVVAQ